MKGCILFGLLIFLNFDSLKAQICTGSLGDPILNITFGVGHNPLPANTTGYSYTDGCPKKGQYTIDGFLIGCGGFWVAMTGDHTPDDVEGNYMLVNAENTPGIVHEDTVTGLCADMSYQYTAYITNVMQTPPTCDGHAVLPNLTFSVEKLDGTILATYNTGDIPIINYKVWKQYGFSFTNTAGVDAVILKIRANAKNGCGNAFALDDIVLRQCSPSTVTVTIDGSTGPAEVCADYTNPFIMKGTYTAGFTDPVVIWQNSLDTGRNWNDIPGESTTTYQVPHRTSGVILYRMVVANHENINSPKCRVPSNSIYTGVHPVPAHKPPQNLIGCIGQDFVMPRADPFAISNEWTGPGLQSDLPAPVIPTLQYADTGLYKLKLNFYYGCKSLDTFLFNCFSRNKNLCSTLTSYL